MDCLAMKNNPLAEVYWNSDGILNTLEKPKRGRWRGGSSVFPTPQPRSGSEREELMQLKQRLN